MSPETPYRHWLRHKLQNNLQNKIQNQFTRQNKINTKSVHMTI